jgi:hypothetical protein
MEPEEESETEEFLNAENTGSSVNDGEAEQEQQPRRSTKTNLGQPPARLNDYVIYKVGTNTLEPQNYKEAMSSRHAGHWKRAMGEELKVIEENKTWELANLPMGRKAVRSKWVNKK